MARLLAWSCLGMTDLEPLNSVDHPSMTLTYLLYSLFLIMGVILLVNMMVALLTHTYERVQVRFQCFIRNYIKPINKSLLVVSTEMCS